ncbi:hypothetical protein, partial [Roseibium sp. RKSG952]|uniref:hypothetical protein n=1 Tax=Roseibium sp. RKSG952 TaxID=2529384 RepID=UPI001AD94D8C
MKNIFHTQPDFFEELTETDGPKPLSNSEVNEKILSLKTKLGKFFRTKHTLLSGVSEIVYCNDGTGTGKSYGQLNAPCTRLKRFS